MTADAPLARTVQPDPFWTWRDAALFIVLAAPSYFLALALTYGLFLFLPSVHSDALRLLCLQLFWYSIWFTALWIMFRFHHEQPFWRSLGWKVPWPGVSATVLAGPVLFFTIAVLGAVMKTPTDDNAIRRLFTDRTSAVMVGLFAATLGPLAEELLFRGFLQPLFIRSFGVVAGILVVSAPFTLLHGVEYNWEWRILLLLYLASLAFGVTRWKTGSTAASTLVHGTYNLAMVIGFLVQRKELFF